MPIYLYWTLCFAGIRTKDIKMKKLILVFGVCILFTVPSIAETIVVDPNGSGDFTNIQDAINSSWHGDTIIVRAGTYNENINFLGRAITLKSVDPNDTNTVESTVIAADSGYSVTFEFGEENDSVLTGFTITGRGLFCYNSSPTISKNYIVQCQNHTMRGIRGEGVAQPSISNNIISQCSGGIINCHGMIIDNTITFNTSNQLPEIYGAGLCNCDGVISNNIIWNNFAPGGEAEHGGGGLYGCDGYIVNNIISNNLTNGGGGGLRECNGIINNNIIAGNDSKGGGGLFECDNLICNNTIVGNICRGEGGAIYNCNGSVINNIIAFNGDSQSYIGGIYGYCNNSYNDFWMNEGGSFGGGAMIGTGDVAVDPLFVTNGYWVSGSDWIDGDYHLKSKAGRWDPNSESWVADTVTSLCIDAGDPCDSIGYEPNPNGAIINMGAYGGTWEASKSTGGTGPEPPPRCLEYPAMDFNKDCKVDFTDFSIFVQSWLECNLDPPEACWQ